ncbi:MAG: NusG domain II-containing protein [Lachnospiraceae bacterium]|nr:NusG domain II-containing protein [Lachnospiraceae bacterium]MBQ9607578.1 NusG domain II-containing protein [Lachnospiraceae bacterium]
MKKTNTLTVADILMIAAIAVTAVCLFVFFAVKDVSSSGTQDGILTITVDGESYASYPLNEDKVIEIGDTNVCEIHDGRAYMKSADCPDQSCVHSLPIDSDGEVIVCLPNKVVLEVSEEKKSDDGIDSVAY